jgi:hypothetical protein
VISSSILRPARAGVGVCLALVAVLLFAALQPGSAETAGQRSTRNIVLAATAVTLGIVLINNLEHKTVTHTTVVGHTDDGGVIYGDGRVLYPGGVVVYLSNDGVHLCAFYGEGARCGPRAEGHPWRYDDEDEWHGEGLHKGWYKGEGNPHHGDEGGNGQH